MMNSGGCLPWVPVMECFPYFLQVSGTPRRRRTRIPEQGFLRRSAEKLKPEMKDLEGPVALKGPGEIAISPLGGSAGKFPGQCPARDLTDHDK